MAVSAVAAVSVSAIAYGAAFGSMAFDSFRGPFGSVSHLPSVSATLLGCGNVYSFDPEPGSYGVFDMSDLKPAVEGGSVRIPTAPVIVPAYGYMTAEPLPDRDAVVYRVGDEDLPNLSAILRSMYSGTIILWYLPSMEESSITQLENWANTRSDVVVMPWTPYTLGLPESMTGYQMPAGRTYAFSAWSVTQSCQGFSASVADDFVTFVEHLHGSNIPSAKPPLANIDENGHLPSIEYAGSDIQ